MSKFFEQVDEITVRKAFARMLDSGWSFALVERDEGEWIQPVRFGDLLPWHDYTLEFTRTVSKLRPATEDSTPSDL